MKFKLSVYLLLLFVAIITKAQDYEYYPYEDTKNIITASADNYFPKLNEPVKLILRVKCISNARRTIGFGAWLGKEGLEFLDGQETKTEEFYKDQVVEMEVTVKFTKKMVAEIIASYSKNIFVRLPFYVNGGFRESSAVDELRRDIEKQKRWIKDTNRGEKLKYLPIGNYFDPNKKVIHNVFTLNKYEESVLEETIKRNIVLFKELKTEYDSLDTIVRKMSREKKMKARANNDSGSKVNVYEYDIPKKSK